MGTKWAGTRPKRWWCPKCGASVGTSAINSSVECFCNDTTTGTKMEPFGPGRSLTPPKTGTCGCAYSWRCSIHDLPLKPSDSEACSGCGGMGRWGTGCRSCGTLSSAPEGGA